MIIFNSDAMKNPEPSVSFNVADERRISQTHSHFKIRQEWVTYISKCFWFHPPANKMTECVEGVLRIARCCFYL